MNTTPPKIKAPDGLKKSGSKRQDPNPGYRGRPAGKVGGGSLKDFAGRPGQKQPGIK